jgi:predicted nucleotidyltransferase component of viral defense system
MNGLAPHTEKIFEQISRLECLKDYVLMGGTALALQLNHRLSEDLDFCRWHETKNEKLTVNWYNIQQELLTVGNTKISLLDTNQCDYIVDGVKITFLSDNRLKAPEILQKRPVINNLQMADAKTIGVMKLEVMSRRSVFRDFYDIYSILRSGISLTEIIMAVGKYTYHNLRTRDMVSLLLNTEYVVADQKFYKELNPLYNISIDEIRDYIKIQLQELVKK